MDDARDEIRTGPRRRRRAYAAVAIGAAVALAAVVWGLARPRPAPVSPAPVAFSAQWTCDGAGPKGGGFCWRQLPPARPRR